MPLKRNLSTADISPWGGIGRFRHKVAEGLHLQSVGVDFPYVKYGRPLFPLAPSEPAEDRLCAFTCLAGGSSPTSQVDIEQSEWRAANGHLLVERELVADIGLVWSPRSAEVYGAEWREPLSMAPFYGMIHALARGHHCYRPVRLDDDLKGLSVLILPQVGAMSDVEIAIVREFVGAGGTLIATGETSLYDEFGGARNDYGLSDVFGARMVGAVPGRLDALTTRALFAPMTMSPGDVGRFKGPATDHSYLRLEVPAHPVLAGFAGTEVIAFGGQLTPVAVDTQRQVLASFVPPFPSFPIDKVFPEVPTTSIPGLIAGVFGRGRVMFMPADVDRRFGIDPIPDHATLLDNLLCWACPGGPTVRVTGAGDVLSVLYRQNGTLLLHLINVTGADNQAGPIEGFMPTGPITVEVRVAGNRNRPTSVELRTTGEPMRVEESDGTVTFELDRLVDHELVVIA